LQRCCIELLASTIEKSSLKASISVTGKKNAKNASTGPNNFSKQYHYAPETPVESTVFAIFGRKTW